MNKAVRCFAKVLGMLALFVAVVLISLSIPGYSVYGEISLGKDIRLIDDIFTRHGVFRIISIKAVPDFPLPSSATMDTVTGKMRQNVVSVQRDDRYIAFKTIDMQTGEKNFYILDKSFSDSEESRWMALDSLRKHYLYHSADSTEFASRCSSLGIPILLR